MNRKDIKIFFYIFLLGLNFLGCHFENSLKNKNESIIKIQFQSNMSNKGNYLDILQAGGKHKCGDYLIEFKFKDIAIKKLNSFFQDIFIIPIGNNVIHFQAALKNKIQDISCRDLNNDGLYDLYVRIWDGGNDFSSYQSHLYRTSAGHLARITGFVDPWFAKQKFGTLESRGKILFAPQK